MIIKEIFEKSDALFANEKQKEAASYLEEQASLAQSQGEWEAELSIINELMGYYRSISKFDQAWNYAHRAVEIAEKYDVGSTVDGVTTYLNVANVYRACGKPEEAIFLYKRVEDIYLQQGMDKDYRVGALYNNMAVASLELGISEDAMKYCEKAIDVLKAIPNAWDECATAYSNLVAVLLRNTQPDIEKADIYMDMALNLFEQNGGGAHYCSALAMKAYITYLRKDLKKSLELYKKAMNETIRYYGRNADYERLGNNYNQIEALLNAKK